MVQIRDAPVPQMVEQLPNILHFFDTLMPDPEQVVEVPKILPDDVPMRALVRETQLAEQLVEVPTKPGYALAVVASKLFSRRELRGIFLGQGSTASGSVQVIDIPVPQGRRGGRGGLQGSLARQNSTAVEVEQNVDIPACRGLQGFLPGQSSTASSSVRVHGAENEGIQRFFFALFPGIKKCGGTPPVESQSARQCQLIRAERSSNGSCPGV